MFIRILNTIFVIGLGFTSAYSQFIELEIRTSESSQSVYDFNPNTGTYHASPFERKTSGTKYYYRLGNKGEFKPLRYGHEIKRYLKKDKAASKQLRLFTIETIVGTVTAFGAVAGIVMIPVSALNEDAKIKPLTWAILGVSSGLVSFVIGKVRGRHIVKAVEIYNDGLIKKQKSKDIGLMLDLKLDAYNGQPMPGIGLRLNIGK